jgi:hypothetical protein
MENTEADLNSDGTSRDPQAQRSGHGCLKFPHTLSQFCADENFLLERSPRQQLVPESSPLSSVPPSSPPLAHNADLDASHVRNDSVVTDSKLDASHYSY